MRVPTSLRRRRRVGRRGDGARREGGSRVAEAMAEEEEEGVGRWVEGL